MNDWRPATHADAGLLTDLERDANLLALAHVFPPAEHAFPYDDVLSRWRQTLSDPSVVVEVVDGTAGLDAYVAHDSERLRHLAVRPGRWGQGLAREAVTRAVAAGAHRLWVLEANKRARGLYDRLGWTPTGLTRTAEWPPYPVEMEYTATEPIGPLGTS